MELPMEVKNKKNSQNIQNNISLSNSNGFGNILIGIKEDENKLKSLNNQLTLIHSNNINDENEISKIQQKISRILLDREEKIHFIMNTLDKGSHPKLEEDKKEKEESKNNQDTTILSEQILSLQQQNEKTEKQYLKIKEEAEELAKKCVLLLKENNNLHDSILTFQEMARMKISYNNFSVSNIALFLPNKKNFFEAYNINCPNYFLAHEVWITLHNQTEFIGEITHIQQNIADQNHNPFELEIDTIYYVVTAYPLQI